MMQTGPPWIVFFYLTLTLMMDSYCINSTKNNNCTTVELICCIPVNNYFNLLGRFPWLNQYKAMETDCLAQGHETMAPILLEPVSPQAQAKHSTTKTMCSSRELM